MAGFKREVAGEGRGLQGLTAQDITQSGVADDIFLCIAYLSSPSHVIGGGLY